MSKLFRNSWISASSWILVFILLACNILLIRQNWQLRSDVEALVSDQRVQIGENFNVFAALDFENNPVTIKSEAKVKKIIFFSSTTCPYCKKQNTYWVEFLKQVDHEKYEVIEVFNAREERQTVAGYLSTYGYDEVANGLKVFFSSEDILQKYKLRSTPITLVLNEDGNVEKVWNGLWDKSKITEANAFFNISIRPQESQIPRTNS